MTDADAVAALRRHIVFKMGGRELDTSVGERMLATLDAGGTPDYQVLYAEAVFLDPPARCFHTADVAARNLILAEGLRPGGGENWAGKAAGQPVGVYLAAEPDLRGVWSHWQRWDVWEVNIAGLPWRHDRLNPGCWIVDRVPADRLTLAHSDLPHGTDDIGVADDDRTHLPDMDIRNKDARMPGNAGRYAPQVHQPASTDANLVPCDDAGMTDIQDARDLLDHWEHYAGSAEFVAECGGQEAYDAEYARRCTVFFALNMNSSTAAEVADARKELDKIRSENR